MKDPYKVLIRRYHTEKTTMLSSLKDSSSNKSIRRFLSPKAVFIVNKRSSKEEIASAVNAVFSSGKAKVVKVNTVNVKKKPVRFRGRKGFKSSFKKAIVTFRPGDDIGLI